MPRPAALGRYSIIARTPCRVDLAGGTLDLWPLYLFHPGAVTVNFAIGVRTVCRITPLAGKQIRLRSLDTRREEHFSGLQALRRARSFAHPLAARLVNFFAPRDGFLLETHSESPAGAGIAGSSALMIATTAALARFTGRRLSAEQTRQLAQNVEAQLIRVPTGCQDYYPALYGGVSAIHLEPDRIVRQALPVSAREVEKRFVLVYTGAPRQSGINNWEVFKRHIDGDRKVARNFEEIAQIARAMRNALAGRDWDEVARLLRREWKLRKANYPGISTPAIDRLMAIAARHGGRAAKVCGAGGGGCVVFMVQEGARERVGTALAAGGARLLPLRVARRGLMVSAGRGERLPGARS